MSAAENRDRQLAVRFLYWHLGQRAKSEHAPVELLADGTLTTFLTVGYVRRSLREMGERPCGEKFARRVIALLIGMGHLADTGTVKKPRLSEKERARRTRFAPGSPAEGGRGSQPDTAHSYWWPVYALPRLGKLVVSRFGSFVAGAADRGRKHEASLSALLRRQDLVPMWKRPKKFAPGSVQEAFHATGPP